MEAIILSSWDHIMGPQVEKLWFINDSSSSKISSVYDKILRDFNVTKSCKYTSWEGNNLSSMVIYTSICGQLLLGEVDAYRTIDEWSSRLFVSEDKILLAVLFHMDFWRCLNSDKEVKDVCLCFGIFFKCDTFDLILYNHILFDQHLRKTVNSFKNSQFSVDVCMKDVTALVEDVTELMESIKTFNLQNNLLHDVPSLQNYTNFNILPEALVSHLQTSGHTIVLGSSSFLITKIIHFLSLFCPNRNCSSTIASKFVHSYIMGVCIQHSTKDIDKSVSFLLERAIKELDSLTVIDLDAMKVWQTIPFQDSFKTEWNTNEIGCLVPDLINDLVFIENNKADIRHFISHFKENLTVKSCALIKAIEHLRSSGKSFYKQEIMSMHAIRNIADFEILLGYAENIKPGIRNIIIE